MIVQHSKETCIKHIYRTRLRWLVVNHLRLMLLKMGGWSLARVRCCSCDCGGIGVQLIRSRLRLNLLSWWRSMRRGRRASLVNRHWLLLSLLNLLLMLRLLQIVGECLLAIILIILIVKILELLLRLLVIKLRWLSSLLIRGIWRVAWLWRVKLSVWSSWSILLERHLRQAIWIRLLSVICLY